jgi:DNA invertase Pin-like site-specific DNA recombinase
MTTKIEQHTLIQIESGLYRDHYLLYLRRSLDEPDTQKNSIPFQKEMTSQFAKQAGLPVAHLTLKNFCKDGVISERHSGYIGSTDFNVAADGKVSYTIKRPKFQRLAHFLSQGYFKGVVFLCWDRASRNNGDMVVLQKFVTSGTDIQFVWGNYDGTAAGIFHMSIDGAVAENHARSTQEKIKSTLKIKRDQGYCTGLAPIGYLNLGNMDHKPFDPDRAPKLRDMFQFCADGLWSLSDLAQWAKGQGLKTVPARRPRTRDELLAEEEVKLPKVSRPLSISHIHKILTNPFYTGRVKNSSGIWIPSVSHDALIDDDLFGKVAASLTRRKVSVHFAEKLDHPYRGLVRCDHCGRVYTPYVKKGIRYYGAKCLKGCSNKHRSFNQDFLEGAIGHLIGKLAFSDEEKKTIDKQLSVALVPLRQIQEKKQAQQKRRRKTVREKLQYLEDNKLMLLIDKVYDTETIVSEQQKLEKQLTELEMPSAQPTEAELIERKEATYELSELVKNAQVSYKKGKLCEKENFSTLIFSELTLSENTLKFKCLNGFKSLEDHNWSVGDPTDWLSELCIDEIRESIEALKKLLLI